MDLVRNHIRSTYCSVVLVFLLSAWCLPTVTAGSNWINHGGDLFNRRYARGEVKISPETVSQLKLKWEFFAGQDITATPAIFDGVIYFPSWNGHVYAVKEEDGSLLWDQNLGELTGLNATGFVLGVNSTVSRATPTIAGDLLLIGIYGPAVVIAVKRSTGKLVWSTQLDNNIYATVTMSGTVLNRGFYVGVSSLEEGLTIEQCCTFIGSMVKLDVGTGAILWKTSMLPDNFGSREEYSGAAIWGSSPSIDKKRNLIYIATGNLYTAPRRVIECQKIENNQTVPTRPDQCIEPENHENSILALDMDHGGIKWHRQLGGYDLWIVGCLDPSNPAGCPSGPNPDADFGEAPMMLTVAVNGTEKDVAIAVQKSGYTWAIDCDNGDIVWSTVAGPGGFAGGGTWGAATDGKGVYTNIANSLRTNYTLPSGQSTTAGLWVAMEASTGRIIWSIANPKNSTASGPVTVANHVLFAGSDDAEGSLYAMDVKTGEVLWSYVTGATVHGGVSVSNGCIYVGNGYVANFGAFNPFTGGTSLYAFCLP